MSKLVGNHNYDVLDNHAAKFKQPNKEFEPRIKNNPKKTSQLLQTSSCYQPPRRRKKKSSSGDQNNEQTPLSTFRKSFEENNDNVNDSIIDETVHRRNTNGLNESNFLNTSSNSTGLKRTAEKFVIFNLFYDSIFFDLSSKIIVFFLPLTSFFLMKC
jgi:hypothetical protein